jgi:ubiquinone/menaquinone biosynthesis C-methylase UbiE
MAGGSMERQAVARGEHEPDRFWDVYSRYYDSICQLMPYRKLLWEAYQALDLEPGMRLLDAGCGTGNFESFLVEKDPPPVDITGVDFSLGMLGVARAKCESLTNVAFRQADLNADLPFEDCTFDRIVSINVLYALDDWDRTIRELLRVLKPEGRLVLTSSAPSYHAGPVIADHVRRIGNIWGLSRKIRAVIRTIAMFSVSGLTSAALNVLVIDRRESDGMYRSVDEAGFTEFLATHSADGLGEFSVRREMADQNLFAVATKSLAY